MASGMFRKQDRPSVTTSPSGLSLDQVTIFDLSEDSDREEQQVLTPSRPEISISDSASKIYNSSAIISCDQVEV
jgi:hypothetical protein